MRNILVCLLALITFGSVYGDTMTDNISTAMTGNSSTTDQSKRICGLPIHSNGRVCTCCVTLGRNMSDMKNFTPYYCCDLHDNLCMSEETPSCPA